VNVFRTWVYYCLYPIIRCILFLVNPVFRVNGRENIPGSSYILCCNHSSFIDPIWILVAVKPKKVFRFLAKKELRKVPIAGFLMEKFGCVFVDRGHHDTGAMDILRSEIMAGDSAMIFPEGTRVKPGKTVPGKVGAIQLSMECRVPIVPMYLTAGKRLWHPIDAIIGKPYYPVPDNSEKTRDEMKVLAEELRVTIYKLGENYA